jgi:hypothetical protein
LGVLPQTAPSTIGRLAGAGAWSSALLGAAALAGAAGGALRGSTPTGGRGSAGGGRVPKALPPTSLSAPLLLIVPAGLVEPRRSCARALVAAQARHTVMMIRALMRH